LFGGDSWVGMVTPAKRAGGLEYLQLWEYHSYQVAVSRSLMTCLRTISSRTPFCSA
jgi:hypothetical protein